MHFLLAKHGPDREGCPYSRIYNSYIAAGGRLRGLVEMCERGGDKSRTVNGARKGLEEPLNKLLNSHPAGFYFYLNGERPDTHWILCRISGYEFICTVCYRHSFILGFDRTSAFLHESYKISFASRSKVSRSFFIFVSFLFLGGG